MPEKRDGLAKRRTVLAEERTRIALDRTMLAWWRTALGLYGVGLAIARLLSQGPEPLNAWLGEAFVVAGLLVLAAGYADIHRAYRAALCSKPSAAITALTGLLLILGFGGMVVAISG